MMRSLWIVITTIALANLIAIGGFLAWLSIDDRLDVARLERVRMIFAQRRSAEAEARVEEDQRARDRSAAIDAATRAALPPQTAAEKVALQQTDAEVAEQRLERVRREIDDLRRTLIRERAELDVRRAQLEKDIATFEAMRKRIAEQEGDEQFRKAVELLQAVQPAKAQSMMQTLIDQGAVDQVVGYLDAMESRSAKKIIEKFEDPKLAADLLERLRTRGLEARDPGKP